MTELPSRPMRDETADERERGHARAAAKYGGLGLQFAASIVLFLFAGQWLDRRLGTSPWLLIVGVFLGAGAAFYSMYRTLMADQRREDEARRAARDERKEREGGR